MCNATHAFHCWFKLNSILKEQLALVVLWVFSFFSSLFLCIREVIHYSNFSMKKTLVVSLQITIKQCRVCSVHHLVQHIYHNHIYLAIRQGFLLLEWLQITKSALCNFAIIRVLPFPKNPQNLDPSYMMDLDIWDCFERKEPCLITEKIWYSSDSICC